MAGLLYESISDDLVSQIKKGVLKDDDRLSERGLAEEYGVSRTVVRDALKVLNEKGYVQIKPGKGHYVKHPDEKEFRGKLSTMLTDSSIPFQDIIEARELIETSMSELIVERATEEDIAGLKILLNQMNAENIMNNRIIFSELDSEFHIALMSCCKNEMLMCFVKTLNDTINRAGFMLDKEMRINSQKEHSNMVEALKMRDKVKMKEAFTMHINCIKEHVKMD